MIEGIAIYRHWMPMEAHGAWGYVVEYGVALAMQLWLSAVVFRARGFDVIHACNPPDTIFLVGLVYKVLFGRRFVFDHHDLNPELYVAKFGRTGPLHRLLCLLERWTFRVADISIATNESYRQVALTRGSMAAGRVFVVRSGPNLDRIRPAAADSALREGRAHLVAYVGTMGQQEGIPFLLEAALQVRERLGRRTCCSGWWGTGPEVPRLRAMAAAMGVDDMVRFDGRLPDAGLLAVLATASVCVNPDADNALNRASTMNKIMEYMAAGKPVVQFDLREGRVSAQEASVYARPDDAADMADLIVALLDDPARCAAMGAYGRARVERELAWSHEASKLLAAYDVLFGLE